MTRYLFLTFFFLFIFSPALNHAGLADPIARVGSQECLIQQDPDEAISLTELLEEAIDRRCKVIRIAEGEWSVEHTLILDEQASGLSINAHTVPPTLTGRSPLIEIRRAKNISFENLIVEGTVELDQTENIRFNGVIFRRGGIHLTGKRCNQPNECTDFNRNIHIENCIFENCIRGIRGERLENSLIQKNRFIGNPAACSPDTVGIELDGSSEDLDRRLELGHSKGNRIVLNSFEQASAIGIRVRDSLANVIRENHFMRAYRALEFYQGAKHNQILQSYISYLSQQSVSGACPSPCAIFLGAGSVNNVFWNNFFEQNFELQFLESNRNRTYIIDESGDQNVFRSDFQRIN